jgi:hypothetical protein
MKHVTQVISEFPEEVKAKYDFSNAMYKGALTPITGIVCPKHGPFQQYAAQLRKNGAGCPSCGFEARAAKRRLDYDDFLLAAEKLHPSKYTYDKVHYVNMHTPVIVTCKVHGDFPIRPVKLLHANQGCPDCGALARGHQKNPQACREKSALSKRIHFASRFVSRAREVHGDLYIYDDHGYTTGRKKVTITCRVHGKFMQAVYHHLKGQGCPKCGQRSKGEEQVAQFLSVFATVERRNRALIAPKELDIYLPEHRIAIEYCGMYWHSCKSKAEERANRLKHFEKHQACKTQGVRLITLYESEWLDRQTSIKRLLRNAVGKSKGRLMARKCELRKVSNADARAFYDRYHPQGGSGHGEHYALFWRGKMVACMRFVLGANDRGHAATSRCWTLGRYATRCIVAGAASRLFKAFVREYDPDQVKSFSDNRFFDGGMYEQLGFALEAELPADYQVWSPKLGLRPKPHYQRRVLPKRLQEHGVVDAFDPETDPRTETEMTYLMGAGKLYDCGKKRWVWTSPS